MKSAPPADFLVLAGRHFYTLDPTLPPPSSISSVQAGAATDKNQWFMEEVHPHSASLRTWLRQRFPWLRDVDEIVQEAMVKLWLRQQKPELAPIHSPRGALFAIARNAAVDRVRHNAAAKTDLTAHCGRLRVLDEGADVVAAVAARQELEFLATALREMPARCRQVITLTKVYGLTEREVGARLGLADSTIRTHVIRGMERLDDFFRARGIQRRRR